MSMATLLVVASPINFRFRGGSLASSPELENVKLSDSLNGIPDGCFDLCSLNSIKTPHSVKYIGNKTLRGLTWTDEIEIPEGVERIGYNAFEEK